MTGTALFAGVDRALFASSFAEKLRGAGVGVALTAVERCAASLEAVGPMTVDDLYWLLRLCFVSSRTQLPTFDAVFAAVFDVEAGTAVAHQRGQDTSPVVAGDQLVPARTRVDPGSGSEHGGLPWATLPSVVEESGPDADGDDLAVPERRATATPAEMQRPFDLLDEDELERVGALIEATIDRWPTRRSRRRRRARTGGPVAMRRSLRRATRTGGDVVTLLRTRPRHRPRQVVVLLDVSASMEHYARAYLHLTRPLAVGHHAEVFAFSTELHRITPAVRNRSPADAVAHLDELVGDRFGGTRLASSIGTLLHHRTWNTTLRGSIVLVCSDGWDADDPGVLDRNMRRLALLAHRVVWVNPRAAAAGFEPTTGGMAAALPHCDRFLAGNTGVAMTEVIEAIVGE